MMGDYNAILEDDEKSGLKAKNDPLADRIRDLFFEQRMRDIRVVELTLTWSNGRKGEAYIGKRLDRIMIKEDHANELGNVISRVVSSSIFDHMIVVLTWQGEAS